MSDWEARLSARMRQRDAELDRMVADAAVVRAAAIERACEAAIAGGRYGVRVTNEPDGTTTVAVDPAVPYGFIYDHEMICDFVAEATP